MLTLLSLAAALAGQALASPVGSAPFKLFGQIIDTEPRSAAPLRPVPFLAREHQAIAAKRPRFEGTTSAVRQSSTSAFAPVVRQGERKRSAEPLAPPLAPDTRTSASHSQATETSEARAASASASVTRADHEQRSSHPASRPVPTFWTHHISGFKTVDLRGVKALETLADVRNKIVHSHAEQRSGRSKLAPGQKPFDPQQAQTASSKYGGYIPQSQKDGWRHTLGETKRSLWTAIKSQRRSEAESARIIADCQHNIGVIIHCQKHAEAWAAERRATEALEAERARVELLRPGALKRASMKRLEEKEHRKSKATRDIETVYGNKEMPLWNGMGKPPKEWPPKEWPPK